MSEKTMKTHKVKIEQIRMDFSVTPEVQRYVYLYLILGQRCYLIDGDVLQPAWDRAYFGADEILDKIRAAKDLVERLSRWACHPLFQRTLDGMWEESVGVHTQQDFLSIT